jgi:myosin V
VDNNFVIYTLIQGKTEAAKYVMRYLITASRVLTASGSAGQTSTDNDPGALVESALLQSTTVLEAFGNAKTVRNDNSSRFGKYIKLQYGSDWRLTGARTLHFLLEKSRLVYQDTAERNYHVFYQLCTANGEDGAKLGSSLKPASEYAILNQGGVYTQSEVSIMLLLHSIGVSISSSMRNYLR